jgi:1-acyl-sn-glycerol-3-phosphate acyltransferase
MRLIASVLYWNYFFLMSAVFCAAAAIACLLTAPFDRRRRLVHKVASLWGFSYIWCNPFWKCELRGLENIDPDATYVLVANHQSFWDIMLLYGLNRHFKWVSKESILKIPFIGWNMRLNEYVSVARTDRSSIKSMLSACRKWLRLGSSVMIFPEGTRSLDGELGEFRDGAFKLACDCDVPVVPIVLDGTFDLMPRGTFLLNFSGTLRVQVLKPIAPADCDQKSRQLRDRTRALMRDTLHSMRQEHAVPLVLGRRLTHIAERTNANSLGASK